MARGSPKNIRGSQVDLGAALAETAGFKPAKFTGFDELVRKIGDGAGASLGFGDELPFELNYTEVEEMRPELVFSSGLENNVNYGLRLAPFVTPGALSISRPIFYCWLELALGGARNADTVYPERPPTELELGVGRLFCRRYCDALVSAFRGISTIAGAQIIPSGHGEGLGQWLRPDSQICLFYEARIGSVAGEIALIIPTKMIIPLRAVQPVDAQKAEQAAQRIDAVWDGLLRSAVETTDLNLNVILGRVDNTLGDVAGFEIGSLIRLDKPTDEPILVEAESEPVFLATLGFNKGRYMLKFEQMIETAAERSNGLSA